MSRKTVDVELRLPVETTARLSELAQLAGTSIQQVVKVLVAMSVMREKAALAKESA